MQSYPWGIGSYPDQLMSRPVHTASIDGGETAEVAIPGAGRYRFVAISTTKAIAVSEPFDLQENDTTGREFTLNTAASASLSGAVGTGAGSAAEVTAWNTSLPEGQVDSEFRTQSTNGTYQVGNLSPGDYLLLAAGQNVSASAVNVQLGPAESKQVDLIVNQRAEIRGTVVLNGQAASRVKVELYSETDSSAQAQSTQSNAAGEFVFSEIPADTYTVRASMLEPQKVEAQRSIVLQRGASPPPVVLDLTPPPIVKITVPAGVNVAPGIDITFMNLETRNTIRGEWLEEQLQAPLPQGKYEVWAGDAVVGTVNVSTAATASIEPPAPK